MSRVSMCRVVGVGCREVGAWWLPAWGIRASQGTFSSFPMKNIKSRDLEASPMDGATSKHIQ